MKSLVAYKVYIAVLLVLFGSPYVAQFLKMGELDNTEAVIIAIAIGFAVDKIIK